MTLSTPPADELRADLRRLSVAYRRQVRAMTYRELCTTQDAPWASIGFGAAGIATALWWVGRGRDLAIARRWLAEAKQGSRARGALWNSSFGPPEIGTSVYYGVDGMYFLDLLFAAKTEALDPSIRAFITRCRRRRGSRAELLQGTAGSLTALVILHRATRDPRLLAAADDLAADLLDRASGPDGWARASNLGFAHGRAGIFHALLGWSLAGGRELPKNFSGELARLGTDARRIITADPRRSSSDAAEGRVLQRSWCNGAAGFLLLWARAHEHTPTASYLGDAREAAHLLLSDTESVLGDLCCGLGGRAYALLAMDRIAPAEGWFDRALVMALQAVDAMLENAGSWPNGLFKGYPGLVCLAHDLLGEPVDRVGFPFIEGP